MFSLFTAFRPVGGKSLRGKSSGQDMAVEMDKMAELMREGMSTVKTKGITGTALGYANIFQKNQRNKYRQQSE